jgi:hypothetical protein
MKEMQPYIDMSKKTGSGLMVYRLNTQYESIHNVPSDVIEKMRNRFQDYKDECVVDKMQWKKINE